MLETSPEGPINTQDSSTIQVSTRSNTNLRSGNLTPSLASSGLCRNGQRSGIPCLYGDCAGNYACENNVCCPNYLQAS